MSDFITNVDNLDPEDFDKISYSEMSMFLRDKRSWYYQYVLGLESPSRPSYISKGTYLHNIVAEMLKGDVPLDNIHGHVVSLMVEEDGGFEVDPDEASRLFAAATGVAESIGDVLTDVAVEQEFYYKLPHVQNWKGEDVLLHGYVDAIGRDGDGRLWLIEHKTASRAWSDAQFAFNIQDTLYAAALSSLLGETVAGATYAFYLPNRVDYRNRFYGPGMFEAAMNQVREVVKARDALDTFPVESQWGTPFTEVFKSELAGADIDYILRTQFVANEERVARAAKFRRQAQYDQD